MNHTSPLILTLCLMVALLTGCAGSGHYTEYKDPNDALATTLKTYGVTSETGVQCQNGVHTNHNCQALASELRSLNSQYPAHQKIGFMSAMTEYQSGRKEQAQFVLDLLLSRHQEPIMPVFLLRAKIAMDEGNIALAREVLHNGLRVHPDHPEMYNHLAATYYLEGRYERSDAVLTTADKLGLAPWKTNYLLGVLHKEKEEFQTACQYFSNALSLNPGHKTAIAHLIELSRHNECATTSIF